MNRITGLILLFILSVPSWAQEESDAKPDSVKLVKDGEVRELPLKGFYTRGFIGASITPDIGPLQAVDGGVVGLAGGYDFGPIRLEAEYGFRFPGVATGQVVRFSPFGPAFFVVDDLNLHTFLGNIVYDYQVSPTLGVHLSGGAGITLIRDNIFDQEAFTYQAGIGISRSIGTHWSVEFDYRFLGTEDLDLVNDDLTSHNVTFGFRYTY